MKIQMIIFLTLMLAASLAPAQSTQYVEAMETGLTKLKASEDAGQLLEAGNHFGRIAQTEQEHWLPAYYQAYCHIRLAIAYMQEERLESCSQQLDAAQEIINALTALVPDESEVLSLQGYIYQGRVWSNPQVNGPKYTPIAMEALQKAIALNPANPRPYHLIGQNLYFTPAFWGGGPEAALPHLEQAQEKFASFEPASSLHPDWGREFNTQLLEKAKETLREGGN